MIFRPVRAAIAALLSVSLSPFALWAVSGSVAAAQPLRHHVVQHRAHQHAAPLYGYGYRYGRRTIAPVDPAYGYSEAPYDPTYRGPGWEVFAMQHHVEQNATLLHEIAPAAKISASGIVVGGY